jgi:hypothetical protein
MIIIETSIFTRQVVSLLPDDEYRKLQVLLANRPAAGDLIGAAAGCAKSVGRCPARASAAGCA